MVNFTLRAAFTLLGHLLPGLQVGRTPTGSESYQLPLSSESAYGSPLLCLARGSLFPLISTSVGEVSPWRKPWGASRTSVRIFPKVAAWGFHCLLPDPCLLVNFHFVLWQGQ